MDGHFTAVLHLAAGLRDRISRHGSGIGEQPLACNRQCAEICSCAFSVFETTADGTFVSGQRCVIAQDRTICCRERRGIERHAVKAFGLIGTVGKRAARKRQRIELGCREVRQQHVDRGGTDIQRAVVGQRP